MIDKMKIARMREILIAGLPGHKRSGYHAALEECVNELEALAPIVAAAREVDSWCTIKGVDDGCRRGEALAEAIATYDGAELLEERDRLKKRVEELENRLRDLSATREERD